MSEGVCVWLGHMRTGHRGGRGWATCALDTLTGSLPSSSTRQRHGLFLALPTAPTIVLAHSSDPKGLGKDQ